MSIEKKSLISTLKTTKKANVAKEGLHATTTASVKSPSMVLTGKKKMMGTKASPAKMPARVMSAKTLSKKV